MGTRHLRMRRFGRAIGASGALALIAASVAVTFPAAADPTTLYVSVTGDDAAPCSETTPCATIQHAVDEASPGDTIKIGSGSYTEDLQISGTYVTLTRNGSGTVDLVDSYVHVAVGATLNLSDVRFSGTGNSASYSILNNGTTVLTSVHVDGTDSIGNDGTLTVRASRFSNGGPNSTGIIQLGSAGANLVVRSSTFSHISYAVSNVEGTAKIDRSTFLTPNGQQPYGAGIITGRPNDTSVVATTTITNSTVSNTLTGISTYGAGETFIANTTIVDAAVAGIVDSVSGTTMAGSVVQNSGWYSSDPQAGDCLLGDGSTVTDGGYNVISDDSCAVTASSSLESTDPKVGPAGQFGGRTATAPLGSDSPAVDLIPAAATTVLNGGTYTLCDGTDQRGVSKPQVTACDAGSMELIATSIDVDDVDVTVGQDTSLTATVSTASVPAGVPSLEGVVAFAVAGTTVAGCGSVAVTSTDVACPHTFNSEIDSTLTADFSSSKGYHAATGTAGLTAAAPSGTTIRQVTTDGTDSGDCSDDACATLAYALSQAVGGDIIAFGPGTFDEPAPDITKDVTLLGDSSGSTLSRGFTSDAATSLTVKYLTISATGPFPTVAALGNLRLENSTVRDTFFITGKDATIVRSTVGLLQPRVGSEVVIVNSTMIDSAPNATTWAAGSIFTGDGDACGLNLDAAGHHHVQDGGHNLAVDDTCGLPVASDLVQNAWVDGGGPTPTVVPASDSPVVDQIATGVTASHGGTTYSLCAGAGTDQRGVSLPQGSSCDIGAVELAEAFVNVTPDDIGWVGDTVTVSAAVGSAAVGVDLPTPAGTLTFSVGGTDVCADVALSGGTANCAVDDLADGATTIDVTYNATNGYRSAQGSGTQQMRTDDLEFSQPDDMDYGDDAALDATSSGGDVEFTSTTPAVCSVSGSSVHADAVGTCTVDAQVPAGAGHTASGTVTRSFDVTPAPLTITPYVPPMDYGASGGIVLHLMYSGLKNGDTGTATEATCDIDFETEEVACSGAADPNYTITYATGHLTINPVPLTITASDESMTAGGAVPTVTPSYNGLVNGDTAPATPPTCTADEAAGTTTCSGAADPHYDISYVDGTLTVTSSTPTLDLTAPTTMTYGGTATVTAEASDDSAVTVTSQTPGVCTVSGTTVSAVTTGSCTIEATAAFGDETAEIAIEPAELTITASDEVMTDGDPLPAVTPTYNGLVNGDTAPATPPTCSADETTGTTTCTGAVDPNYDITYVDGSLTITDAPLIVFTPPTDTVYGSSTRLAASATPPAPIAFTTSTPDVCSISGTTLTAVAVGTCTVTAASVARAAGPDPVTHSFQVLPAPLTITAGDATMTEGDPVPTISASYNGLVNGDTAPATPPTCTADEVGGTTSCTGAADDNYDITYVSGTLTVTPAADDDADDGTNDQDDGSTGGGTGDTDDSTDTSTTPTAPRAAATDDKLPGTGGLPWEQPLAGFGAILIGLILLRLGRRNLTS